jgi:membrane-bound metal-dependent hydrolase YbcI (DUF457 family)
MFWYAHLLFGIGVASLFTLDPIVLALAGFLSVISDLDKPFGHREWFSHSILTAGLLAVAGFAASTYRLFYAIVVFLTVSSHAILDSFTKSGAPLFYPVYKKNVGLRLFTSKNKYANRFFSALGVLMICYSTWSAYPIAL